MTAPVITYPRFRAYYYTTGLPLVAGQVTFFVAGTSTPQNVYTDPGLTTPYTQPVVLDANGEALIYGLSLPYKVVIKDSVGNVLSTSDGIAYGGSGGATTTFSEWIQFNGTPTYIGATSFSVVGDQRALFQVPRRVRFSQTAGTGYNTVQSSSFGGGVTTVQLSTVGNTLDSGLSVVSYSFISASAVTTSLPMKTTIFAQRSNVQSIPGSNVLTAIVPNVISTDTLSEMSGGGVFTPKIDGSAGSTQLPQYLVMVSGGVSVNQVYTITFSVSGTLTAGMNPAVVTGTTTSDLAWSGVIQVDSGSNLVVRISAPGAFDLGGGTGTFLRYSITRLTP